jgi:hypothetical protein
LRVIAISGNLGRIDVLVKAIFEIDLDGDLRREVELAVERASAVPGFHRRGRAELVDPRSAGRRAVEAGLDAVAFVLDLGEDEVDLGDDAGDVEAVDVWVGCKYGDVHNWDEGWEGERGSAYSECSPCRRL